MEILHIENLSFNYSSSKEMALSDISFTINEGDFILVCGQSGCGKTTLLKMLKKELKPNGDFSGKILYFGNDLYSLEDKISAKEIGFVMQNPNTQIVTDKVWHELAFGLENLGTNQNEMKLRIAEISSYFGLSNVFSQKTDELSGGQKQILNLASVLALDPKVIILDEPTSQLDPIAASEFISALKKINTEFGITIIIAEHRLEELFSFATKVLVMEKSKMLCFDEPKNIEKYLNEKSNMFYALPVASKLFKKINGNGSCPLTVKEGKDFLEKNYKKDFSIKEKDNNLKDDREDIIEVNNIYFRYSKNTKDILTDTCLKIKKGEIHSILGGNGSGKSTLLNLISGLIKPYKGNISINNKKLKEYKNNSLYFKNLVLLPQDPSTIFIKDSVIEDYKEYLSKFGEKEEYIKEKIESILNLLDIKELVNKHPFDLSGGELQKCAIGKLLLCEPKILILDEPTKGIDAYAKNNLKNILLSLQKEDVTVIMVTHDLDFASEISNTCSLLFNGEIVSSCTPSKFFSHNNFYTTAASRMSRNLFFETITLDDLVNKCKDQKGDNK